MPKVKEQSSFTQNHAQVVAQVNERTCLNEATIIMESDDDTEELLLFNQFLSKPRRKQDLLPGKNISFYKQKFDCFLSSV